MIRTARRASLPASLSEIWQARGLLRSLVTRDLRVKYQRSVLGFLWTFLNPLLTVAVLVAVFTHVVRMPITPYWAFLLSGYFVWNFLLQTLTAGTFILAQHAQLSRNVAYPREVPVIAAVLSRFIEFAVEMTLVVLALILFHHRGVPPALLLAPWLAAVQILLVLGLVFPIATLAMFYHDIQHALPIVLTTLFYLSPVFYPVGMVPEVLRPIFLLSPVAQLLTLYHDVLYAGTWPPLPLLLQASATALGVAGLGYAVFHRFRDLVAEIV
jgi:ABC-2 type transport system permease protein